MPYTRMPVPCVESGASNQWFASAVDPDEPWYILGGSVHKDAIMTGVAVNDRET